MNTDEPSIRSILHEALAVNVDTTLHEILTQLYWDENASIVVISQDNELYGIITKQDISIARKHKVNFNTTHAWEICSQEVKQISPDATLGQAMAIMKSNNIHHLVVMEDDVVNGVITSYDIPSH